MDLELSDEQRLLRESVGRFLSDRYGAEQRRRSIEAPGRWSRALWREIAELGWLALGVPEADGGLGGGAVEVGLVAEGLGRALAVEPFLEAVLSAGLVSRLGTPEQRAAWLPPLVEGRRFLALAHQEGTRALAAPAGTVAESVDEFGASGWRLHGRKDFVAAGAGADAYAVTARVGGGPETGVFLVEAGARGLGVDRFDTVDGREACRLRLEGVAVPPGARLGSGDATPVVAELLDFAAVAVSAEAVGCMDALLAATVDYTRTREQFGRPLAANQVLRHRMADMSVALEEARGIALRGALALEEGGPARARATSAVKNKIGRAGRAVAESAIQLHGGMGVTEELGVGLYAKRLLAIDLSFGTGAQHLRRHAGLRPGSG